MIGFVGIAIIFVIVFGGYVAAGGKLGIIQKSLPLEMIMIGCAAVGNGTIRTGAGAGLAIGDRLRFLPPRAGWGEVIALTGDTATILPEGAPDGVAIGDALEHVGPFRLAPSDNWLGRIVDPMGRPMDGRALLPGRIARDLRVAPPNPAQRRRLGARLATGLAAFDTLLPIVQGQRIGLFAGSGVGKSSLLGSLARGLQADVVVLALIGERGRELREFAEDVIGAEALKRTVIVAATSDQSPLLRRRCAYSAMTAAEHFRD